MKRNKLYTKKFCMSHYCAFMCVVMRYKSHTLNRPTYYQKVTAVYMKPVQYETVFCPD